MRLLAVSPKLEGFHDLLGMPSNDLKIAWFRRELGGTSVSFGRGLGKPSGEELLTTLLRWPLLLERGNIPGKDRKFGPMVTT